MQFVVEFSQVAQKAVSALHGKQSFPLGTVRVAGHVSRHCVLCKYFDPLQDVQSPTPPEHV